MREPPYATELKPYGRALVELGRRRVEVLCLSGDLTRQTEVDLFQAEFPDRFIHGGMAEANMMGMAGALARCGFLPLAHPSGTIHRGDRQLAGLPCAPSPPRKAHVVLESCSEAQLIHKHRSVQGLPS